MQTKNATTSLPLVPVRATPSEKAEMVTQMLFGETCRILEQCNAWMRIELANDGYQGWVDQKMITPVTHSETPGTQGKGTAIIIAPVAQAIEMGGEKSIYLPAGSILGQCDRQKGTFQIQGKTFQAAPAAIGPAKGNVAGTASLFIGAPYLWGGKTIFGIDCSGLVQTAFALHGIQLPRDARQQARCGREIPFEERASGDLAFFSNEKGEITHVGILAEGTKIIHASGSARADTLDSCGIFNQTTQDYTHRLHSIRRITELPNGK